MNPFKFLSRGLLAPFVILGCVVSSAGAAELLSATLDKVTVMRLGRPASVVIVGSPEVADVSLDNPRLIFVFGRRVGETSLMILDENGDEIASFDVVVSAEPERHVTVHRSTASVGTLSCNPRCTRIENPGIEAEPEEGGGGSSDTGLAGASTATSATSVDAGTASQ